MTTDTQVLRLPINIPYNGRQVRAEIIGKTLPFIRFFTCRIPGADMLIIEARPNGNGLYCWAVVHGREIGYLLPFIGKEIERHLNNTPTTEPHVAH